MAVTYFKIKNYELDITGDLKDTFRGTLWASEDALGPPMHALKSKFICPGSGSTPLIYLASVHVNMIS